MFSALKHVHCGSAQAALFLHGKRFNCQDSFLCQVKHIGNFFFCVLTRQDREEIKKKNWGVCQKQKKHNLSLVSSGFKVVVFLRATAQLLKNTFISSRCNIHFSIVLLSLSHSLIHPSSVLMVKHTHI